MTTLEERSKKRTRRKNLKHFVLAAVAIPGSLAIAAIAPGVAHLLLKYGHRISKRQQESISAARKRLLREELLVSRDGKLYLTPAGEQTLAHYELQTYGVKKPKRWDGKWRVLIFDIPEKRKTVRERVRLALIDIGFVRAQDSVWAYPYNCEEFVALLKADARIGTSMLYLIVEEMENDTHLRAHFGLPKKD